MTAYRKVTVTDVCPQSWTLPDSDPTELGFSDLTCRAGLRSENVQNSSLAGLSSKMPLTIEELFA
jgi:hypothetical protein